METGWTPDVWENWPVSKFVLFYRTLLEEKEARDYVDWSRHALVCSVIANVNRGKRGRQYKVQDFIGKPPWERRGKKQKEKKNREDQQRELKYLKHKFGES